MTEPTQLTPATTGARGRAKGRFSVAFGRRFFLMLLVGLIWIGPMWTDRKYLLGLVLWDAAVLVLWVVDLRRLPKPEEIEVRRIWGSTLQLREPAEAILELQLHRLTRLSIDEITKELNLTRENIAEFESILGSEKKLRGVIIPDGLQQFPEEPDE